MTQHELRPLWNKLFTFNWKFGLFLIVLICVPRFILVLQANKSGSYGAIGLIMLISALAPYIFLTKAGRREIGIVKPTKYSRVLIAFVIGLLLSLLLFIIANALYGHGYSNWYAYIGKSYNIPAGINEHDRLILFLIMALTGMIFSPIGEELFFRGIVHGTFAASLGDKKASLIDSAAFAIVHLSHFGIVYIDGRWQFLPLPSFLWIAGMFVTSLLFFAFKKQSGSLLGAIICHAAFNLGMIYCIFYLL